MSRTKVKPVYAALAGAVLGLIVLPIAFAGASSPEATTSASVKKQVKKLKKRVAQLENQQAPDSLPPNGPAGGDLTGTFPNPLIGPAAVGTDEIADGAVGTPKIADDAVNSAKIAADGVGASEIAADGVGGSELKGTYAAVSPGVEVDANQFGDRTAACNPGDVLLGGGHSWQLQTTETHTVHSTPDPLTNPTQWIVRAGSEANDNTLFAWAVCLAQ